MDVGFKRFYCSESSAFPIFSFLRSGCDVISTNTYQVSPGTLSEALNVSLAEAKELMRHAVRLARRAVDAVLEEEHRNASAYNRKLPILIAGSLGSYGACLADGSEYSGEYGKTMEFTELVEFHQARAELLLEAGVDLLAWETIPLRFEVAAICEVMRRLPNAVGWVSIISLDGQTSAGGDPLHEIALEVDKCDRVITRSHLRGDDLHSVFRCIFSYCSLDIYFEVHYCFFA